MGCDLQNEEASTSDVQDSLSRASFGTVDHRIQFRPNATRTKYSPDATGFDDTSGATYSLQSVDSNAITYIGEENSSDTLVVTLENDNTVTTTLNGTDPQTFTPKASNLGARP